MKKNELDILWAKNGINNFCLPCSKNCKQHAGLTMVSCAKFTNSGINRTKVKKIKENVIKEVKSKLNKVDKEKGKHCKFFQITNIATSEVIQIKNITAYSRDVLKLSIEDHRRMLYNTIGKGQIWNGIKIEKVF